MKALITKHHRSIFYLSWVLLGLFQSIFTELMDDEAYYWVFSKYLDWGYFDHPPMIALVIKIGTLFLGGELGVRIVPLLLSTATIYLTEKLLSNKEHPFLFYAIVLSVGVLQVSGFIAAPDIPLMFFTALFLEVYRSFIQTPSWRNTFILGLVAACLLYSKYHGVLVLGFVLLSNLKLFRSAKVYVAGIIALALFVPHLYWQYQHDWISFKYHLLESNVNPYRFSYTTDYILGQALLAGPIAGVILWAAAFKYQTKNKFERALKWEAVGFMVFFFLSTFKGKVEPNWTSPAIIPVMVLAHQYLLEKEGWRRWLIKLLPITIVLTIVFRIIMVVDIIPAEAIKERYHGWQDWPQELRKRTEGLPVVFNNSYQRASKYWFYSGQMTYSLNRYNDRRNNYNFWPVEDSLLGKPVYILDIYALERFTDSIKAPLFTVGYRFDSSLHSFAAITFKSKPYEINAGDSLTLNFTVDVPPHYSNYLNQHPEVDEPVSLGIFSGQELIKEITLTNSLQSLIKQNITSFKIVPGVPTGNYILRFGIFNDSDFYSHNSDKIKLRVK